MSSFNAFDFIFDDIPSHIYDLQIISFEDGGLFSGVGSSNVKIITQKVLRKSKPYYLGRTQEPVLQFPLTFGSVNEIDAIDRDLISAWLFGRSGYKKLYILQDDLQNIYFNCFLTNPEPLYIGGINYAFACQVVCDSPFAYGPERTVEQLNPDSLYTLSIYNSSSEDDYIYPNLEVVTNIFGVDTKATLRLKNLDDNNRITRFISLPSDDTININNDLQIISSAQGYSSDILQNFNKKWLRLVPGQNRFSVTTQEITSFTITFTERLKVGG